MKSVTHLLDEYKGLTFVRPESKMQDILGCDSPGNVLLSTPFERKAL